MKQLLTYSVALVGRLPLAGKFLRRFARAYPEGSVIPIKCGYAKGLLWRRHHRYVNGYWVGVYELPVQEAIVRELRPGNTFFDVGANAGFFTLVAARAVGSSGKCVAFEPLPDNAESVSEQIALNQLAHCHLVQEAVSNHSAVVGFSFASAGDSQAHLGLGNNSIQVHATTLDEAFQKWGAPHLIKMDIEGAEGLAMEGAELLLKACRPVWIIELHGPAQEQLVKEILSKHGYRFSDIKGSGIRAAGIYPRHIVAK